MNRTEMRDCRTEWCTAQDENSHVHATHLRHYVQTLKYFERLQV